MRCNNMLATLCVVLLAGAAVAEKIGIAATVNDQVITTTDVTERTALIMESSHIPPTEENVRRVTPRALQGLIEETLEMQEAKRQSITVTEAELEKALDDIGARQKLPPGGLQKEVKGKGLSVRSLESQVRAQLAWNKVVQRKLRRNVTVSQDELKLAADAAAAAPGTSELRLTALIVPITKESKEADIKARIDEIAQATKSGQSITMLAEKYMGKSDVQFTPPTWVAEETMPADVQRLVREVKEGDITPPTRSGNAVQFIELLDRRVTKKLSAATEVTIKQLTVALPSAKPDKAVQKKITDTVDLLRKDAGSCEDVHVPATPMPVEVVFARPTIGNLGAEQVSILSRLNVGEVSEPLVSQDKLRMVLLCERREPTGATPANDALRQELFAEKMDLEAQKHLRNLRREASIDIREQQ